MLGRAGGRTVSVYALDGYVDTAEHGDGITLLGGWVRLPEAGIPSARLRLTTTGGLRQDWPLARLLARRDLPAEGPIPAGRGFQLLVRGLPDWSEGALSVVHAGGEIPLHPPVLNPAPFRPRGHLDGADGKEAWGWLVHAPGTEAVIEMEGMGRLPVRCDVHRADLPFDDGSPLPAFGFHLHFAGTALANGRGPRRVTLHAAGVKLGEVMLEGQLAAGLPPFLAAAALGTGAEAGGRSNSRITGLLAETAPVGEPASTSPPAAPPLLVLNVCRAVGLGHLLLAGRVEWTEDGSEPTLRLLPAAPAQSLVLFDEPDLLAALPPGRTCRGFLLVGPRPGGTEPPLLEWVAGRQSGRQALPGDAHGPTPDAALHQAGWGGVFHLLREAAGGGAAAALLSPQLGPAGAFTRWLAGVPWLEPADFPRVEAWAAPSGECAMAFTLDPAIGPDTRLTLLALLLEEGRVRPLPMAQSPALTSETMLLAHGLLPQLTELPAPPFELVMEMRHAGEAQWFRVNPRTLPAPLLLAALHRHAALPAGPELGETLAWLRDLLQAREESFAAMLIGAPPPPPAARPLLLVLHGLDDAEAVRLLAMAAPAIEARADALLLLGAREFTEPALEIFLSRGRIAAHGGAGLAALRGPLRRGLDAAGGLVILDMLELAAALERDDAFQPRLPLSALPLLEQIATVAGLPDAADAVARLSAATGAGLPPPGFGAQDSAASRMVAGHLHGFWRGLAPLFQAEAADA
ncbi:hypothetical protein [Roseococcus suduntuyensis]|uniref:Uncharacterized protein n=1 Tax=Roseococcus suduntuyensis TaxID=455361 RepID=A0A840AGE7_9PROT|nr:hypothetical protein [Roseococcus suduntuyensis]MBB3899155.1 hypothetical protein [Roseococcus suduntuyensis]